MSATNYENTFYKTFSGADSLAFVLLPESKPILLGSLTTISYSMYRDKKPVPLVGKINISGYTRGMRVIAGSMIFTLINQHFTKDLLEQVPYLKAHGKIKADELPLFDIMVISANEYGAATKMMIYGIDITDDAQVLSVEDLFTENTFNFVARDIDEFTAYDSIVMKGGSRAKSVVNTVMPYDFDIDNYNTARELVTGNMTNKDLITAQTHLMEKGVLSKVTGVYDGAMLEAVKSIQLSNDMAQTGILDVTTFDIITRAEVDDRILITVPSTNGVYVYDDKEMSKINGIAKYKDSFLGIDSGLFYEITFFETVGYVLKSDVDTSDRFTVESLTPTGDLTVYDLVPTDIGAIIDTRAELDIKISAISHYGKKRKAFSKHLSLDMNTVTTVTLDDLTDAFVYNIDRMAKPDKITFIVMSQGKFTKQWSVTIKGA
jgi:hypothetical protein